MHVNKRVIFLYVKIFMILFILCYVIPTMLQNLSELLFENLNHIKYDNSIFVNKNLSASKTFLNTLIKILHFIY
jgi:hypothetical protein